MTSQDLDTSRKMKSIKLGHGPLGSMKQALHSQQMEVKLQGMNMYKARKPYEEHNKEDIKELAPLLKKNLEKRQPQDGTKLPGMQWLLFLL